MTSSDYSRIQLNGLQVGQPGTAPLRYGNRPLHKKDRYKEGSPDNPCPTCGLELRPEPPCTTTRDGKTQYKNLVEFTDKEAASRFKQAALAAVHAFKGS